MKNGSKGIIIALALVFIIGAGAVFALNGRNNNDTANTTDTKPPTTTNTDTQPTPAPSTEPTQGEKISIEGYKYSPEILTVKAGTTVTWTNKDNVRHNVLAEDGQEGPKSELLAQGESYSYTFDKAGTFSYYCGPHPYMKAKIIVE